MSLNALVGNSGETGPVCEGFSKEFKVLCDNAGIPCELSTGIGSNNAGSDNHMWNIVQIDGQWYGMDATWNDPNESDVPVTGLESNDYTLLGSDTPVDGMTFSESHQLKDMGPADGYDLTNEPALSPTPLAQ